MRPTLTLFLACLAACGKHDDTDSEPVGTDDTGPECSTDPDCSSTEICELGACIVGDRDNDPADATPLGEDADGNYSADGEVGTAGDVDWFSFSSTGSQFIRVDTTVSDEDDDADSLDTIVTIYDASGALLAQEDEHPAGDVGTYDSVAFAWLNDAGTYTVSVEDKAGRASPDTSYVVTAKDLGDGGDEPDSLQSAGTDLQFEGADLWYALPVVLTGADDTSDSVLLTMPWTDTQLDFILTSGANASELDPAVRLYNSDGDVVLDKGAPTLDDPAALVNSESETYVLNVADAAGGSGPTYWGVVFALVRDEGYGNPRESEPNDAVEDADPLSVVDQEPNIGSWVAGYGSGHLDTAEDVDSWTLAVDFDDAYLSVFYGAQDYGGVAIVSVDIVDSTGAVVASMPGTAGADADLWNAGPFAAGDYTVRFSSAPESTGSGEGAFYQFAAHASTSELAP